MSFYLSLFVWIILGAVLALGIVLATKWSFGFIVLALGMLGFLGLFVRYGCLGNH